MDVQGEQGPRVPAAEQTQVEQAWERLGWELGGLDDAGLAAVAEMARWARANLPGGVVCLTGVLDAARQLAWAMAADRHGCTVEEIERVVADALAGEGGANG